MSTAKLSTGVELYYEIHGKGDKTAILLNGTGFACDVWREHPVSDLKDRYRFVIFDPRGVGRSSRVDHFFNVYQLAADTAALLDHLQIENAYVLGHSMGGRIALALTVNYPVKVKSLFLAATGSGPAIRPGEGCIPIPSVRWLEGLITRGFQEYIRNEIVDSDGYFTQDFRKARRDITTAFAKVAWEHHADLKTYLRQVLARRTFEITHQLGSIKIPVWIVVGDSDFGGGSPHVQQSYALKERIPHAVLKVLPNQNHGYFWQDPEGTKTILTDWLEESTPAS